MKQFILTLLVLSVMAIDWTIIKTTPVLNSVPRWFSTWVPPLITSTRVLTYRTFPALSGEVVRDRQKACRSVSKRNRISLRNAAKTIVLIKRLAKEHSDVIGHPSADNYYSVIEADWGDHATITLYCTVGRFSEAQHVLYRLLLEGFSLSDAKPFDNKYSLSRRFSFLRGKNKVDLRLEVFASADKGAECQAIITGYSHREPEPVYEIVCDEEEAEARLAPDPLFLT